METHSTEAREAEMEAPASPSLAALLLAQRTLEAIVFLRHADSEQLKVEISLAFEASPSAPSELLACATLFASSCKVALASALCLMGGDSDGLYCREIPAPA